MCRLQQMKASTLAWKAGMCLAGQGYFGFQDSFDSRVLPLLPHIRNATWEVRLQQSAEEEQKEELCIRQRAELQIIVRMGRGESRPTLKHLVIGPCILPVLPLPSIGSPHSLFLFSISLGSRSSTRFQAQHLAFSPLATPPRSVLLRASAGHALLACLHGQSQSTLCDPCSLGSLSLLGCQSSKDWLILQASAFQT